MCVLKCVWAYAKWTLIGRTCFKWFKWNFKTFYWLSFGNKYFKRILLFAGEIEREGEREREIEGERD